MAVKILGMVWDGYPGESSVELLAMLALADWSDDVGRSFPSIATIGKKCRIGSRQAQRLIHRLIEAELITVIGNKNGGAPKMTRHYRINLNKLTGVINVRGVESVTGVKNDADGCHLRRETGGENVTQYVIDTSLTAKEKSSLSLPSKKRSELPIKQSLTLPEWLPLDVLDDFKAHRIKLKKPMTDRAVQLLISELEMLALKKF